MKYPIKPHEFIKFLIFVAISLLLASPLGAMAALQFTDRTAESGLSTTHSNVYRTWDVAVGDINGDGINDLYGMDHAQGPNQTLQSYLFLSSSNMTLTNITSTMATRGGGQAALFTDLDADGDLDLMTSSNDGVGAVLSNDGSGKYNWYNSDFPGARYHFDGREIARGDIEGDGDLDTIVGSHGHEMTIFVNNGSNVYTKQAFDDILVSGDDLSVTLQIMADFDNDGDTDMVSQRMSAWISGWGSRPTTVDLWLNDGSGKFRWVSDTRGLMGGTEEAPLVIGDFDNDADLDIVQLQVDSKGGIRFFENDGNANFTENAAQRGFAGNGPSGITWWAKASVGDLDNDGDLDIINNGREVYVNDGAGHFTKEILSVNYNGIITRVADMDNDGDLDVVGARIHWEADGDGYYIYRNDTNNNRWLIVKVDAGPKNPYGVGAKIKVFSGAKLLGYREMTNSSAMHLPLEAHFGLGECGCSSVRVEVTFPDGSSKTVDTVEIGQKIKINANGSVTSKLFTDGFES
ncbi:CRTAC1 family protein [Thiolapillus sp.]